MTKLIPQTKLAVLGQVAAKLRSAPSLDSAIEIASGGGYSLTACRNKYAGGCAFHVRKGRQSFVLVGYTSSHVRQLSEKPVADIIESAEAYITKFNPGVPVGSPAGDIELPPVDFSNAINNINPAFDFKTWPQSPEWKMFVAGFNSAARSISDSANLHKDMAHSQFHRFVKA